ncbi:hypothetical protein CCACVL1_21330 [Corchorus capsularis]|uniref:J domain-containing protein n=1 Tax=Corchorus capsularis TaxID=210143 RepID=A0A1R3H6R9_COCAP|nr:hypothetical protein CCACVL1_21330 [Corchorus capsularis]
MEKQTHMKTLITQDSKKSKKVAELADRINGIVWIDFGRPIFKQHRLGFPIGASSKIPSQKGLSHHFTGPMIKTRPSFNKQEISRWGMAFFDLHINFQVVENFYDLLGISESGSLSEIKQAYKQLVRKYHPDVSPPERIEEHTQRFIQVQEAYETLSDPKTRALYDTDMAKGFNLAFSAGNRYRHVNQDLDENRAWKIRWQAQLIELERRSMNKKNCKEKMSWAARIRMQAKG